MQYHKGRVYQLGDDELDFLPAHHLTRYPKADPEAITKKARVQAFAEALPPKFCRVRPLAREAKIPPVQPTQEWSAIVAPRTSCLATETVAVFIVPVSA